MVSTTASAVGKGLIVKPSHVNDQVTAKCVYTPDLSRPLDTSRNYSDETTITAKSKFGTSFASAILFVVTGLPEVETEISFSCGP